jgi:hypothetical protein
MWKNLAPSTVSRSATTTSPASGRTSNRIDSEESKNPAGCPFWNATAADRAFSVMAIPVCARMIGSAQSSHPNENMRSGITMIT